MRKLLFAVVSAVLLPCAAAQQSVFFATQDGVKVHADYYPREQARGAIVLFNGAPLDPMLPARNRCEYGTLPAQLQQQGFAVLNVDLRMSGNGNGCQTLTKAPISHSFETLQDLDAALSWMRTETGLQKAVLLGSGFSSMLVMHHAMQHPEQVQGVLTYAISSSDIDLTEEVAMGLGRFQVPVLMVGPSNQLGLAGHILGGLPPQLGKVVAAPEVEYGPLGFNQPETLQVYLQATQDFLKQLFP